MILARLPAFPSPSCQQSAHLLHLCASSYIRPLADFSLLPGPYWTSLALDLDSVSAPGLMPLPSPWICLPEPACLSSLPGVPVFAQSPVKWPVAAHPAPASASAYQPVSLDQSTIQHQSAGRPRTDILGHFRISHLPAEEPLPGPLSHTETEKWFLHSDWWLPVCLFPRPK
ncbi:hypothetical protein CRENBAI_022153 [Crenichthys baileyi]|uniref:Uncharacterized protein n=1 Tax=Crenichthys baileyi TaxID=28760 RepID=A0AAV9RX74_9TELE